MEYSINSRFINNSCCHPGAYNGFNLYSANPFDDRKLPFQANEWCSNELILRDKNLRCQARVQPVDVTMRKALNLSQQDAAAKGLWLHH